MTTPHDWSECRPALIELPGGDKKTRQTAAATAEVWATLSSFERMAFHRFCCENDRSIETMQTVARMQKAIQARVE